MATRYLIENGHRNIALVTGTIRQDGVVEKRFLGYKRALQEFGLFYNPDFVFEDSVSYIHGLTAGRLIAEKYPEITGGFCHGRPGGVRRNSRHQGRRSGNSRRRLRDRVRRHFVGAHVSAAADDDQTAHLAEWGDGVADPDRTDPGEKSARKQGQSYPHPDGTGGKANGSEVKRLITSRGNQNDRNERFEGAFGGDRGISSRDACRMRREQRRQRHNGGIGQQKRGHRKRSPRKRKERQPAKDGNGHRQIREFFRRGRSRSDAGENEGRV